MVEAIGVPVCRAQRLATDTNVYVVSNKLYGILTSRTLRELSRTPIILASPVYNPAERIRFAVCDVRDLRLLTKQQTPTMKQCKCKI
jgi:hypothetical protein